MSTWDKVEECWLSEFPKHVDTCYNLALCWLALQMGFFVKMSFSIDWMSQGGRNNKSFRLPNSHCKPSSPDHHHILPNWPYNLFPFFLLPLLPSFCVNIPLIFWILMSWHLGALLPLEGLFFPRLTSKWIACQCTFHIQTNQPGATIHPPAWIT